MASNKPAIEYRSGRHCVFMLHVHLVFTPKYWRHVFKGPHIAALKGIFDNVCQDFGATLTEMDGEHDHVHLLVNYPPSVELSRLVNSLKGVSSRLLRKQCPDIMDRYWKNVLWSRSYFAASCGGLQSPSSGSTLNNNGRRHEFTESYPETFFPACGRFTAGICRPLPYIPALNGEGLRQNC